MFHVERKGADNSITRRKTKVIESIEFKVIPEIRRIIAPDHKFPMFAVTYELSANPKMGVDDVL